MRQYDYLFVLGQTDVLTQSELMQLLGIDRSTNTLVIGLLEKKRLVERWGHPEDSRKKCVQLTPLGAEVLTKAKPQAEKTAREFFSTLDKEESRQLLALLNKVIDTAV